MARISRKVAAIAESATLAVDAKAKALQAAGEHVIGFGAGEPDFPTPEAIVEAAVLACRDERNHKYSPAAGLPELREALVAKTKRDSGFEATAAQVLVTNGGKQAVANTFAGAARPRRRGAAPGAVLDDLPGEHRARRRHARRAPDRRGHRLPRHRRPARRRGDGSHESIAVRVAVEPDRRGVPARARAGDRGVGARARHLDRDRRDLRAPDVRPAPVHVDARARPRPRRHVRDPQRRREDLRDDGLARRLDDRAARRDRGGRQPPVPHDVERRERVAARRARRR